MAFVMPAPVAQRQSAKGYGKGKNTRKFEAGKRLYANQVLHCQQGFVSKYPGRATVDSTGATSAKWECLGHPERLLSAEAFANALSAENTELFNRPGVGLSELGGVLLNLNQVLEEGLSAKVFDADLVSGWRTVFEEFNFREAAETLNSNDYPDADRSSAKLLAAVQSVAKLGNHVREHWSRFSILLGLGSAVLVDTAWLCTLASLTIPGVYADKVKDVPVTSTAAKARLIANPTVGKHLISFLSEEVHAQHKVRVQANVAVAPPAAPPAFVPLTWDDSDGEPTAEAAADPAAEILALERSILDLDVPEGKAGAGPSRKRLRAFAADLDTATNLYAEKYSRDPILQSLSLSKPFSQPQPLSRRGRGESRQPGRQAGSQPASRSRWRWRRWSRITPSTPTTRPTRSCTAIPRRPRSPRPRSLSRPGGGFKGGSGSFLLTRGGAWEAENDLGSLLLTLRLSAGLTCWTRTTPTGTYPSSAGTPSATPSKKRTGTA